MIFGKGGNSRPGLLGGGEVALAVEGNVAECVAVDELYGPVEQADDALQDEEEAVSGKVAGVSLALLRYGACLTQHVDQSDDQAAETDRTKAVRQSATSGAPRRSLGHVV